MLGKMVVNQPPDPIGHGQDPALGLFAIRPAFTVNDKPALLPKDVVFFQIGQLAHPQARVQEGPDDELFIEGLTGIGEPVDFVVA